MPENHNCLVVRGGKRLVGSVRVSGGKNAVVALIPAVLLAEGPCTLDNVPDIEDVRVLLRILEELGAGVTRRPGGSVTIDPTTVSSTTVDRNQAQQLRASYYFMGALVGRYGHACVAPPGGCLIGQRPIDQHKLMLETLGTRWTEERGVITLDAPELTGGSIFFTMPTVGGTINAMLTAARARGTTTIRNAAREPHVVDVANFINRMGGRIIGAGTNTIRIEGRERLHGTTYSVVPDQIETGTLMIFAAATHGDVCIQGCIPTHMEALSAKMLEMGVHVTSEDDTIHVWDNSMNRYRAVTFETQVYPGFPTDLQQPLSALLTVSNGTSRVYENIFENRFGHLNEITRMGGHCSVDHQVATIDGVPQLYGANVSATDLRAGAALLVAGLIAEGETHISNAQYIDRGYEHIENKLRSLQADITRV